MLKILDIPIYSGPIMDAVETVIQNCQRDRNRANRIITATSAHGMVISKENEKFRKVLTTSFMNLPDGMPLVWMGKLKGFKETERCYGPVFMKKVIKNSSNTQLRHFFCGGKPGIAQELKNVCENKLRNFNIIGTYSPPFRDLEENEYREIATDINSKKADIVWIGLSTPKQELFAEKISEFLDVKYIITVGAAFDFITNEVKEAPEFIQKCGLEWFFRLCIEPRRLFKRYSKVVPYFIAYIIRDIFSKKRNM